MSSAGSNRISGWTNRNRDQIYDHVYAHQEREVGGVLVGSPSDGGIEVKGVIKAVEAVGSADSLTFTHEAWESIHSELDDRFPESQVVGWYHSHPGLGVFLSRDDLFIHQNFFSETWQVAHVVDPVGGEEAMFGWKGDRIVELSRGQTPRGGDPAVDAAPTRIRRRYPWSARIVPVIAGAILGFGLVPTLEIGGDETSTSADARISADAHASGAEAVPSDPPATLGRSDSTHEDRPTLSAPATTPRTHEEASLSSPQSMAAGPIGANKGQCEDPVEKASPFPVVKDGLSYYECEAVN